MRLQHILIVGFVLTAAITIAVGTPITYSLINNYLEEAQDERVGRDMDLANAFYNNKLDDISATARRIASARCVQHNMAAADPGRRPRRHASSTRKSKTRFSACPPALSASSSSPTPGDAAWPGGW